MTCTYDTKQFELMLVLQSCLTEHQNLILDVLIYWRYLSEELFILDS